jgi:hypothetical protein
MSIKQLEEIKCPCGEVFEAELLSAVSIADNPDYKEMLISGEFNIVCCPKCGEMFYAERFILYHDSADELIAFVYPASFEAQAKECHKLMLANFKEALKNFQEKVPEYEPVLFFGVEDLANVVKTENDLKDEEAVVKHLAKTFGFGTLALAPSKARLLGLPKIMPVEKGTQDILPALKKIIEHNLNLINYAKTLIRLSKDAKLLGEVVNFAKPVKKSK